MLRLTMNTTGTGGVSIAGALICVAAGIRPIVTSVCAIFSNHEPDLTLVSLCTVK